jgi:selenide,water dikinase
VAEGSVAARVRLTEWTTCGGCAAKWGAGLLRDLVDQLDTSDAPGLLVGLAPYDDAAVLRLTDDVALVSTTDFFPPLVDDPADFGAVAAANACSDVFAMGGEVRIALNLAAFPEALPVAAIEAIFRSAGDVVREAGGLVAGGHTIRSEEPIFGLAVQGTVHPDRVWTKGGARPGDVLLLSKPLGTGIVLAGGSDDAKVAAVASMRTLNRAAAAQLHALDGGPHACTDVTGYGLLGHAREVAERSGATVRLDAAALPLLDGALAAATAGVRTGGDARNRSGLDGRVHVGAGVDPAAEALAFDPQTSGGLLASVRAQDADGLIAQGWTAVGEVRSGPATVELG